MNHRVPLRCILVVTSTYPRHKGDIIPRFVHDLSLRLSTDFEVRVLAPSTPGSAAYELMDNVHVHRFRYFLRRFETLANVEGFLPALRTRPWRVLLLPLFLLAEAWAIGKLARRYNVSLIHAHWIVPQGLAVWVARLVWRLKQPLIVTCHGADLFALNGLVFRYFKRRVLLNASATTVVSEAARRQALKLGAREDCLFVYPMGVDLSKLFIPGNEAERIAHTLLFVGRLNEKKGVDVFIRALPLVRAAIPGTKAEIVGDGPDREALRALVVELALTEAVAFHGAVKQERLAEFYNRAACFVFPSVVAHSGDQEGLGLVLVEALGCGCPVVASRLAAVQDVVKDGESGLLFTPGDSSDLANNVIRVLNEPVEASAMASVGRTKVVERYNWDRAAGDYLGLYRSFSPNRSATGRSREGKL